MKKVYILFLLFFIYMVFCVAAESDNKFATDEDRVISLSDSIVEISMRTGQMLYYPKKGSNRNESITSGICIESISKSIYFCLTSPIEHSSWKTDKENHRFRYLLSYSTAKLTLIGDVYLTYTIDNTSVRVVTDFNFVNMSGTTDLNIYYVYSFPGDIKYSYSPGMDWMVDTGLPNEGFIDFYSYDLGMYSHVYGQGSLSLGRELSIPYYIIDMNHTKLKYGSYDIRKPLYFLTLRNSAPNNRYINLLKMGLYFSSKELPFLLQKNHTFDFFISYNDKNATLYDMNSEYYRSLVINNDLIANKKQFIGVYSGLYKGQLSPELAKNLIIPLGIDILTINGLLTYNETSEGTNTPDTYLSWSKDEALKREIDLIRSFNITVIPYVDVRIKDTEYVPDAWKLLLLGGQKSADILPFFVMANPSNTELQKNYFERLHRLNEYYSMDGLYLDSVYMSSHKFRIGGIRPFRDTEIGWFDFITKYLNSANKTDSIIDVDGYREPITLLQSNLALREEGRYNNIYANNWLNSINTQPHTFWEHKTISSKDFESDIFYGLSTGAIPGFASGEITSDEKIKNILIQYRPYLSWFSWSRAPPAKEMDSVNFLPAPLRFPKTARFAFSNVPTLTGSVFSDADSFALYMWNNNNSTYTGTASIGINNIKKTNAVLTGKAIAIDLDNLTRSRVVHEIPQQFNITISPKSMINFNYKSLPEKTKIIFSDVPMRCLTYSFKDKILYIKNKCTPLKQENEMVVSSKQRNACKKLSINSESGDTLDFNCRQIDDGLYYVAFSNNKTREKKNTGDLLTQISVIMFLMLSGIILFNFRGNIFFRAKKNK